MLKPKISNYADVSLRRKKAISKYWQKTKVLKLDAIYNFQYSVLKLFYKGFKSGSTQFFRADSDIRFSLL